MQLSSSNSANLFPGSIIPDGQGGVLATWTIVNVNPPAASLPYQAAYVSGGGYCRFVSVADGIRSSSRASIDMCIIE